MKQIETIKEEFDEVLSDAFEGIIDASYEDIANRRDIVKVWLEKALKENTEQVIDAMLVEEREPTKKTIEFEPYVAGYNQCCAEQKQRGEKLKTPKGEVKSD